VASERQTTRTGTVFDIGYQSYQGVREGRARAWRSIFWDGIKNGMGIGRGGWAKFLPWLVLAPTIIIGLVFAAMAAFFEQLGIEVDGGEGASPVNLPGHADLITATAFLLLVFGSFTGPELICPDRRNKIIHLYFVRPILMIDYLGARWCALVALLFLAALLPHLTLWIGLLLGVPDAVEHIQDNWLDIPRFIGYSALFAVFTASFIFALSSLTDRRMIATLIAVGTLIVLTFTQFTVSLLSLQEWAQELIRLLDLIDLLSTVIPAIIFDTYADAYELNMFIPIVWLIALTAASIFASWRFYQATR